MVQGANSKKMSSQKRGDVASGELLPDLPDLMNDWFFGTADVNNMRAYYMGERININEEEEEEEEEEVERNMRSGSGRNHTGRLTQEWQEEAKKIVAVSSSGQPGSPARFFGSPRFASADHRELAKTPLLDRKDPLSRSARRYAHKSLEGISDEILRRSSSRQNRNPSDSLLPSGEPQLPTASNPPPSLPPNLPVRRTSRFRQDTPCEPQSPAATSRRTFRSRSPAPPPPEDAACLALSPPRNLVESAHRRSVSSTTCSLETLSRPEKEKGSSQPRSISSAFESGYRSGEALSPGDVKQINAFLSGQRKMIGRISRGEVLSKAKIILSGSSNGLSTTSTMVAAICYAWLLQNREEEDVAVIPVVNIERGRMNKHEEAAWLFFHVGIDASALLFADEVDLGNLLMNRQLSMLVIGQDVLKTKNEVGSLCTILTDNYCEEAYDLLQNPKLKNLLLAGILLDTHNLNSTSSFVAKRDAEAVRLLSTGSSPDYRHELFEQLMQDHKDSLFLEALKKHYGKATHDSKEKRLPVVAAPTRTPNPVPLPGKERETRGKNKFFLAKWFGFGSK
ncbi:hypothetical protein ZIOFF_057236 [Zingiber officinale]|uniref:Uncharacterized protein n=2 Tax=Zingiber officinale TaxID=94328 RepID=A0A8J5F954_ZINOF|nr:hypothetical protein ZIOFF_057236 [Zingiber officinale]